MKRPHRPLRKHLCRRNWTAEQRLEHLTKVDPLSGCLIWQGGLTNGGYGHLTVHGRTHLAHRLAWLTKRGPIPPGVEVCHACDERRCVNTDHLYLDTHAANMADLRRKRHVRHRLAVADLGGSGGLPRDASAAEITPIRIFIRGMQFIGEVVGRPFVPDAGPARPAPVPAADRTRPAPSPRRAAHRGRPRTSRSPRATANPKAS